MRILVVVSVAIRWVEMAGMGRTSAQVSWCGVVVKSWTVVCDDGVGKLSITRLLMTIGDRAAMRRWKQCCGRWKLWATGVQCPLQGPCWPVCPNRQVTARMRIPLSVSYLIEFL